MRAIRTRVAESGSIHHVRYGAVYASDKTQGIVDFYYEVIPHPRVFEWNALHSWVLAGACVDIDGVLCVDPSEEENDDGPRYREFLQNAAPLYVPAREVGWLVTSRLEKYRGLTQEWLARQGVRYGQLIMMNFPDKASRVRAGSYAAFKAATYEETGASLFIESSLGIAHEIVRLNGKDVLCTETWQMVQPTSVNRQLRRGERLLRLTFQNPGEACARVVGPVCWRIRSARQRARHRREIRRWLDASSKK
jgi:orotate phosphoribosyltransferase